MSGLRVEVHEVLANRNITDEQFKVRGPRGRGQSLQGRGCLRSQLAGPAARFLPVPSPPRSLCTPSREAKRKRAAHRTLAERDPG